MFSNSRRSSATMLGFFWVMGSRVVFADTFAATFEAPTVQLPSAAAICGTSSPCVLGVENFDSWGGGPFFTDFGTAGEILGEYSGSFLATAADQYGGAGGVGVYPEVFEGSSYTLSLTTAVDVPGVNYFGLWFSALDPGNLLQFYADNTLLYSFTPDVYISLVGDCPSSSGYCGNPNANFLGNNSGQQYAYLNFYDMNGFFNKVVVSEVANGGFESDNHAVAYLNPPQPNGTLIGTPEPASLGLLLIGSAFLVCRRRRVSSMNPDV